MGTTQHDEGSHLVAHGTSKAANATQLSNRASVPK